MSKKRAGRWRFKDEETAGPLAGMGKPNGRESGARSSVDCFDGDLATAAISLGDDRGGDYMDALDSVIPEFADDIDCYASVLAVDWKIFVRDIFASIICEDPALSRSDKDYKNCVTTVLEWFLDDVMAVARSFDLPFEAALSDMLEVLIKDTPLTDGFVNEIASWVTEGASSNSEGEVPTSTKSRSTKSDHTPDEWL